MTPNKNTKMEKKIREIWAKIQTDYEDELEEGINETIQLFYAKMEEIIGKDENEYECGFVIGEGNFICRVKETGEEVPLRMVNKESDRNELRASMRSKLSELNRI